MKYLFLVFVCIASFSIKIEAQKKPVDDLSAIKKAAAQLDYAFEEIEKAKALNPKLVSPRATEGDTLIMSPAKAWTSGFFPGNLWYMYELTGDKKWLQKAQEFTANLEGEKTNGTTHDMGFKMYCSFGNGLRLAKTPSREFGMAAHYRDILIQSARTLTTRFNEKVGCIRSWDHSTDKWEFPVIIDNMMNLELLFWAFKETKDSNFYKIAVTHANTTMKNHFRPDFSSFHVIGYDPKTGEIKHRNTHQGYSHASAWARGQGWALYGYTMCYRETSDKKYLQQAENVANFILTNPNMPTDLVPYWDYNVPDKTTAPRDVSAATIVASALYELSTMGTSKAKLYKKSANKIMKNVAEKYTAAPRTNKGFLLTNSTGNLPSKSEINVPIVYADYYYLEALVRRKNQK